MINKRFYKKLDLTLIAATGAILAFSLVMISSASTDYGWWMRLGLDIDKLQDANILQRLLWMKKEYAIKQLIWIALGCIAAAVVIYIPYEDWRRYTRHLYIINLIFLAMVLVLGYTTMGAERWIDIGPFAFQPSEFAKLIIIITLADFLAKREGEISSLKDMLPCFIFVAVPMIFILMQPDLGTSLVFIAILFGMLAMSSLRPLLVTGVFTTGVVAIIAMIWAHMKYGIWIPLHEYQLKRLTIFLDPWSDMHGSGYHVIQSQIAIGSSGFWGKGLLLGTQSFLEFLPIRHTDFIFSVLAEETGMLGALILLALFGVFLYRSARIAQEARDMFGSLLAVGIVSMIIFQILINIGMAVAIMPVTGIPLPMFSYGGSSMIANILALGILLNVYMRRQKNIF